MPKSKNIFINQYIMKRKLIISIFLLFLICNAAYITPKTNFSGAWKLNIVKSEFGIIPQDKTPTQFNVQQKDKLISIERISSVKDENGDF